MKKETLICSLILLLGIIFEGLYLMVDSTFWGAKFYLLGAMCTLIGFLGLWIYTIMPFINRRLASKDK